jgi:hypothetical protein
VACKHDGKDPPNWPFAVPDETRVFASVRVLRMGYPVLIVSHDDDGDWEFSCATTGEPVHTQIACLGCLVEADPTLAATAELPRGWLAYRLDATAPWQMGPAPEGDNMRDSVFPL